jgi:hypothetical protein
MYLFIRPGSFGSTMNSHIVDWYLPGFREHEKVLEVSLRMW